VFEVSRAKLLFGFTWGHIGYAMHNNVFLLQTAKLFGIYGLSFFVIVVNILIYLLLRSVLTVSTGGKQADKTKIILKILIRNVYLYILIFLFASSSIYGFLAIKSGEKKLEAKKEMKVAVVQGGLKTRDEKTDGFYKKFITDALKQNPDIVILPENTLWFLVIHRRTKLPLWYEIKSRVRKEYDEVLEISRGNKKTSFVIGFHTTQDNKEYNSLVVMKNGEITGIYDKRFLMPFSETGLFSSSDSAPAGVFLKKGSQNQTVKIKGVSITPLICSEIIFPELARDKKSRFIINIGNDSVFDNPVVAEQNHIISKVRAVENSKYIVRSMKTGISSIIDPFGRVIVHMGTKENGTLVGIIRY
jgi:apolipoprotein N-acyltransferase